MSKKAIRTGWNLSLLYKSEKDPQIERDMQAIERAYAAFAKKYKGKDFTSTPKKLHAALQDAEQLLATLKNSNPSWYFALRTDLNSEDKIASAKSTINHQRIVAAVNIFTFFDLEIGKIPAARQKQYLRDKILAPYAYLLKTIFDKARYNLSEGEEQLAGLLTQTSYSMWVEGVGKLLARQTVPFKGKRISLAEAGNMLGDLPKTERHKLHNEINKVCMSLGDFAEAEMNAVYNWKKTLDERRGLKEPYTATLLAHETDEKTVLGLADLVSRSFKISHRFFRLQAKLLNEKRITVADRNVKLGEVKKKFDLDATLDFARDVFSSVDPVYAETFDRYLTNGQIDVYPRKGKRGGAYCWGGIGVPTFVLLNHVPNVYSVETLAHEMGHAFHTELSKGQPLRYQSYTTATAEVASTFFEQVAQAALEKELDAGEYAILLHDKIRGDIASIFRQIACFNFELELHRRIRAEGFLAKEQLAALMQKHLQSYFGPAVEVTLEDGYNFVSWWHIRRFFYVYSYAYGQLISRALFEKWQEDKSYAKKIEQFLKAGGSMSPKDIFKSIGIDTSDPKFFETGLKGIERDIAKLEKLTK